VKKTNKKYDSQTIGIITSQPGVVVGDLDDFGHRPVMVALAGRVPVKVNLENGPIHKGDLLTPSSYPGVAMKATKAGVIIGQSMTDYLGDQPTQELNGYGYVVAFIKNGYGQGSKLADILAISGLSTDGSSTESSLPDGALGTTQPLNKQALSYFLTHRAELGQETELSEIYTDRLSAGLEVITPTLVADDVQTHTIRSSHESAEVAIKLADNGKLTIGGEDVSMDDGTTSLSAPSVEITKNGDAYFAGTVTAKNVVAESISGLEIFTDKISSLSESVASGTANDSAKFMSLNNRIGTLEEQAAAVSQTTAEAISDIQAVVDGIMTGGYSISLKDVNITGALSVTGLSTLSGGLAVNSITSIANELGEPQLISLMNDTEFFGRPYFNADTAGFAVILAGAKSVTVHFTNPYLNQPIVSADISLESIDGQTEQDFGLEEALFNAGINYLVTRKSPTEFTILLNKPAPQDIRFSWIALAVKDALTIESEPVEEPIVVVPPVEIQNENSPSPTITDNGLVIENSVPEETGSTTPSGEVSAEPATTDTSINEASDISPILSTPNDGGGTETPP
jgi:hypothetical protein